MKLFLRDAWIAVAVKKAQEREDSAPIFRDKEECHLDPEVCIETFFGGRFDYLEEFSAIFLHAFEVQA